MNIVNIEYDRNGEIFIAPVKVSKDATVGITISNLAVYTDDFSFISAFTIANYIPFWFAYFIILGIPLIVGLYQSIKIEIN